MKSSVKTKRISNDTLFMNIAEQVAQRSTCLRIHVGAVLVKDDRIISIGYNGVPSGRKHCVDHFMETYTHDYRNEYKSFKHFVDSQEFRELHRVFSEENEIHSEMNIISFAAKNGISTNGTTLYTTLSPCHACSKMIIQAGIDMVIFKDKYDRAENDGLQYLSGMTEVYQIQYKNEFEIKLVRP
jgi:dCMP deaminase